MECKIKGELGTLLVAEEVIAALAGNSCLESYGIVAMGKKRPGDGIVEFFKRDNLTKGVKVATKEDTVNINLHIIVEYGVSIAAVAKTAMESVKYNVETFSGARVERVNVFVEGIRV